MRQGKNLSGNLTDVSVADLLQILGMTERTGTLQITRPGRSARLVIEQGRVMTVELRPARRYLAGYFLEQGWIDFATLHRALVLQVEGENHRLIGQILVELGALTDEQLREGVGKHVRETIAEVMYWEQGYFEFSEHTSFEGSNSGRFGVSLNQEEIARLAEEAPGADRRSVDEGSWPARSRLAIVVTGDVLVSHGLHQTLFSEAFSVVHAPSLEEVTGLLLASEDHNPSLVLDLDVIGGDSAESVRAFESLRELYHQWPNLNLVTFGRQVPEAFYDFTKRCRLSFHLPRPTQEAEARIELVLDFVDALAAVVTRARLAHG